jgi:pteridine reductase
VALVTGSGKQRVGWYVADALAQRGYTLAVHYRSSAVEAAETIASFKNRRIEVVAIQADLTDEQAVRSLIRQVLDRFGRLDVLVNCAAVWKSKRLENMTAADVRLHFETNTLGTFLCAQHAGLAMVKQPEGGCIINRGDWAEGRPYCSYLVYREDGTSRRRRRERDSRHRGSGVDDPAC